jgi:ADP-ribose pyrophosphatase YjhB (NUDIX family)
LEWDEDVRAGAIREFAEETGLQVRITGIVAVHSNFHIPERQTVGIWFAGEVEGGTLQPVDGELAELAWVAPHGPPPLAFPTDEMVMAQLAGVQDMKPPLNRADPR